MSRVIALVLCGFTLAGCSASIPGLDFLKSSPTTAALRFESVPPGAEVKVSGQTCRTPCELTLEVADLSATFTRRGYQEQTIPVHPEQTGVFSGAKFTQNPVHADLVRAGASARRGTRERAASAGGRETASPPIAGGMSAEDATAPGNGTAWTPGEVK